ncbi:hypothetical protein ABZ329_07705 [Streptomyces rubiginosohelvolus]|uniref:hypothetical protein n=1 Tax=Streptomyces rubiginosohelvolus TaxID=67362 RepID=UPI003411A76A
MAIRTHVAATVRSDRLDDVLHALGNVDPNVIVASVNRSNAPGASTGLSVSLAGDVREAVKEQLEAFPELQCRIDVIDDGDL